MSIPRYDDILDLLRRGATLEAQRSILALYQAACREHEDNLRLRERVRALELQLDPGQSEISRSAVLELGEGLYWRHDHTGRREEPPLCPVCWNESGHQVPLEYADTAGLAGWHCEECGFDEVTSWPKG